MGGWDLDGSPLIILACLSGSLVVLAGLIARLGALRGIILGLVTAAVVIGVYLTAIGPWQRRWGATEQGTGLTTPGDELLRPDAPSTTRAISIQATPEAGAHVERTNAPDQSLAAGTGRRRPRRSSGACSLTPEPS
ncbi:MAG: hypothetical protein M3P18_17235 [Actinomycetota bacterium]|nr:hypothetical protein [Actinomycetota bacterium]